MSCCKQEFEFLRQLLKTRDSNELTLLSFTIVHRSKQAKYSVFSKTKTVSRQTWFCPGGPPLSESYGSRAVSFHDCAKNVDKNWNIIFIIHVNFDHAWAKHYPVTQWYRGKIITRNSRDYKLHKKSEHLRKCCSAPRLLCTQHVHMPRADPKPVAWRFSLADAQDSRGV